MNINRKTLFALIAALLLALALVACETEPGVDAVDYSDDFTALNDEITVLRGEVETLRTEWDTFQDEWGTFYDDWNIYREEIGLGE